MNNKKNIIIEFSPKTIIWVITTIIAVWFVFTIKDVLIILFLSYIFAAAIDPMVDKLEKKKIPRAVGILIIYLILVGILALFFRLIIPPVINQFTNLAHNGSSYVDKLNVYAQNISPSFKEVANGAFNNFDKFIGNMAQGDIIGKVFGVFSGALGLIAVFVIGFYLLVQKNGIEKGLAAILPERYHKQAFTISNRISIKMSSWVRGQLFLAFVIFVANYIALSLLKVDFALTLAIISGFLELLPIIGPIISGTLAALVALTVSPILALIVAGWYVLVQQLENHILVPQIMRKSVGLNPIIIIVAILAGGKILGILGIIIAVPVVAALSVIVEELFKKK